MKKRKWNRFLSSYRFIIALIVATLSQANMIDKATSSMARSCKTRVPKMVVWQPPPDKVIKLNTFASIKPSTRVAYGGELIRNNSGMWHSDFVCNINCCSRGGICSTSWTHDCKKYGNIQSSCKKWQQGTHIKIWKSTIFMQKVTIRYSYI